jgi:hypothetical protein
MKQAYDLATQPEQRALVVWAVEVARQMVCAARRIAVPWSSSGASEAQLSACAM